MSEFDEDGSFADVQFEKFSALDYSTKLQQLMLNDEYLKNKIQCFSKGLLAYDSVTIPARASLPPAVFTNDQAIASLDFTCESDRLIRFYAGLSDLTAVGYDNKVVLIPKLDGAEYGYKGTGKCWLESPSKPFGFGSIYFLSEEPLTAGKHTFSIHMSPNSSIAASELSIVIEDVGKYIPMTKSNA